MAKPITDIDAMAGGVAAFALMQSLLVNLDSAKLIPRELILRIISDASMTTAAVMAVTQSTRPATERAQKILDQMQAKWLTMPPQAPKAS